MSTLGIAALAGAVASLVLVLVTQRLIGHPPLLPWSGPLVLLFVAALLAGMAFTTWRRIQVRREPIEAQRAVTFLALGKASAIGGAAITAGYLVFAFVSADNLAAAGPQQRVIRGLTAAVAGVLIMAAGLWLERACRVPEPPDEDEHEEPLNR
ncbi:DUF3180 domain-containing protein [Granulicoccus sp. GXG6511]|uniref:DUF3180 domain-containing protein n=1 Tax=Granulicoccus sp. GXG6511 TaxID=3381351 RepID=UPI003D7CE28A